MGGGCCGFSAWRCPMNFLTKLITLEAFPAAGHQGEVEPRLSGRATKLKDRHWGLWASWKERQPPSVRFAWAWGWLCDGRASSAGCEMGVLGRALTSIQRTSGKLPARSVKLSLATSNPPMRS